MLLGIKLSVKIPSFKSSILISSNFTDLLQSSLNFLLLQILQSWSCQSRWTCRTKERKGVTRFIKLSTSDTMIALSWVLPLWFLESPSNLSYLYHFCQVSFQLLGSPDLLRIFPFGFLLPLTFPLVVPLTNRILRETRMTLDLPAGWSEWMFRFFYFIYIYIPYCVLKAKLYRSE